MIKLLAENLPRFAWSTPQRQKLKFLPLRRYNLTLNLLSRSHDWIASGRQIAINGHIKFNLTIPLQQLNGLETLVIIMVANKYAFLQITRRRFLNEWEAFKKVISRRNIRRRITIALTLSTLKLLRRINRTENSLHRNFTRRQVVFLQAEAGIRDLTVTGVQTCALPISGGTRWPRRRHPPARATGALPRGRSPGAHRPTRRGAGPGPRPAEPGPAGCQRACRAGERSEERRVGKECRSRWSPYH